MKKLILFLALFFFSESLLSQVNYNDLMSINSVHTFQRIVIENNFEFSSLSDDTVMVYGYNLYIDSSAEKANQWAYFNQESNEFLFLFTLNEFSRLTLGEEYYSSFYNIIDEIKTNCTFYKIIDNYSCYSCSKSSYKGKIGFKLMDGNGLIRHFQMNRIW